ncbi:MAG: CAP domain-containing protein [Hyphomicrobiales bacterium]|nr:CAP domain-containing protein [Hyphomicrobiales bacterium]MDE2113874.1 CAP domain-containing protein [Hyphomicrobiales bacterium]
MATANVCAVLATLLSLSVSGCAHAPSQPTIEAQDFYESMSQNGAVLDPRPARDMISILRHNAGVGALKIDPALQSAALAQAQKMAQSGRISTHAPALAIQREVLFSDNSAGFDNLAEAFAAWRQANSTRHHMLNAKVTRIGVAAVYAPQSRYKVFWSLLLSN